MSGLITWNTHLHVISHRHNLFKQAKRRCPTCQRDNCPPSSFFASMSIAWCILVAFVSKLALFLPDLESQLRQSIPTPWGVWTQRGGITYLWAINGVSDLDKQHVPILLHEQGMVGPQAIIVMEKPGMKRSAQARLLAFFLPTLHKLRDATELLAVPQTQDFHGMNSFLATHSVLQRPDRMPSNVWVPYEGEATIWLHWPLLFQMGRTLHVHVLIPGPYLPEPS